MTLGIWRWDGEVGIFCLAELYVHINEYEIERDAQVIKSDLFYSFTLPPHIWSFSVIFAKFPSFHTLGHLLTENLPVHMIINCYLWFLDDINSLIIVKIHGILKRWNVLFIILISHYIEKNKLKKVSNYSNF